MGQTCICHRTGSPNPCFLVCNLTGFSLAVSNVQVTITYSRDPREALRDSRGVVSLSIVMRMKLAALVWRTDIKKEFVTTNLDSRTCSS